MSLRALYRAGSVRRYHANPDMAHLGQTNADHQGRCVQLLLMLHPAPSLALIRAVACHDVGEVWAGDLPGPFKRAEPNLAALHAEAEQAHAERVLGCDLLGVLDRDELRWLALMDALEALAFMATHAPQIAGRDGWPEARRAVIAKAWAFGPGVAAQVQGFVDDLGVGQ